MKKKNENIAIVIMAGGSGTRLWPVSRKDTPKQFQALVSEKTLLEETYERAKRIVPEERIFISSGEKYRDRILSSLHGVTRDRLLLEPSPQGTGPAIGLVSMMLEERFPGVTVATIASDHAIENEDAFVSSLKLALETVSEAPKKLAVIGINPTSPDTGLGYIRMGDEYREVGSDRIFFVDEFKEKPDRETAETYLSDWRYLWNAGYFIFSAKMMLLWIESYAPGLSGTLSEIRDGAPIAETYARAENEAIEPIVVEKLPVESRIVVPAPIQWSDIGTWGSLFDFLSKKHEKESFGFGDTVEVEGSGNLLYGGKKKTIAVFGVEDLVVIDADDAILVTSRHRAGDIKTLISELKRRKRQDLL